MKRRFLPLLLSLCLLCSLLPAASAQEEEFPSVTALCVAQPGGRSFLDSKEFQLLCRQATGHDLESVTFSSLSAGVGKLTCQGERVTPETAYYLYQKPQLSQVYFTPYVSSSFRFTGQAELAFTLMSEEEETVSGTLLLHVPEEPDASEETSSMNRSVMVKAGEAVSLEDLLPSTAYYRAGTGTYGGGQITSAIFTLPSSDQGSLWLDYEDSHARKLLPDEVLFPDKLPNYHHLTFVPATNEEATVTLRYTASSDKKKDIAVTVTLNFKENKEPVRPSPSVPGPDPFTLYTRTTRVELSPSLGAACQTRNLGKLETVIFDVLPLTEEGSVLTGNLPVTAGEPYPWEGLSFLPGEGFQGGVTLRYVATDSIGYTYSGFLTLDYGYPDHVPFLDLDGWEWAMPAATFMGAKGYRAGQSTFDPGAAATRMDLIHALVLAAYSNFNRNPPVPAFSDLPDDETLAADAAVAAERGLVLGDGAGRLLPDAPVTRQDALVILHRAMVDRHKLLPLYGDLSRFSDAEEVAPYAREAATILTAKGIVLGDNTGKLDPLSPITRAEMACLLFRAFGE